MRNRSVSMVSVILVAMVMLSAGALQAQSQWTGGNNTTSAIYRSGAVGVGTSSSPSNQLHVFTATSFDGIAVDGSNSPAINFRNAGTIKGYLGLATSADAFFSGTAANDLIIRSGANKIHFGQGTGSTVPTMTISGSNVGLGITGPYYPFHITTTNADTTGGSAQSGGNRNWQAGAEVDLTVKPPSAQSSGAARIGNVAWSKVDSSNTFAIGDVRGVDGYAENYGSGTVNSLTGTLGWGYNASTSAHISQINGMSASTQSVGGTVDSMTNLSTWSGATGGTVTNQQGIYNQVSSGGATVTNQYGIYSLANGNVTNRYGLYLDNGTGTVTNDYGIFQNRSTSRNYFAGPISIGNNGGAYGLNVFGAAAITLGPDASVPRFITYDDGTNAAYSTFGPDLSTYYKSSGAYFWKTIPTGATRMSAAGTQTMVLDAVGNLAVAGQIISQGGGYRFPDGSVQTTAVTGGGGGSVQANNIGSGNFGACCSGGNFSFPARLGIGTTTPGAALDVATGVTARGSDTDLVIGSTIPQIELYHAAASAAINYDGTHMNFYTWGPNWSRALTLVNGGSAGFGPLTSDPKALISIPNGVGAGGQVGFLHNAGSLANKAGLYFGTNSGFNGSNPSAFFGITVAPTGSEGDFALVGSSDSQTHRKLLIGYNTADDPSQAFQSQVSIDTYNGNIVTSGTITGAKVINAVFQDVAEWVPATETLAPGTVVVLNPAKGSQVAPSKTAYDTTVAGVVSEHPGIVLGTAAADKAQVATTGRVRVKVDASRNPIKVGDLLVTSDVAGTAMRSVPVELGGISIHRPGTIIGKALEPLEHGTGEILVLLSLQ